MSHPHSIYVVSEDLHILLDRWSQGVFGRVFDLDYPALRERLARILAFTDHEVMRIPAERIQDGMMSLAKKDARAVISLDPVYLSGIHMLHVTRCVDTDLRKLPGIYPRFGSKAVDEQIHALAESLGASPDHRVEVTLADDVVFSGDVITHVMMLLREVGIDARRVVSGITIITDPMRNPHDLCAKYGAVVDSVFEFPRNGSSEVVVDEICERDFFLFSPMCGRTIYGTEVNTGAPYFAPFGQAASWASFGEHEANVSRQILQLNIDLLRELERQLGRPIRFQDLERQPYNARIADLPSDELLMHLREYLK